jgi:hypothetical protein
MDYSQQEVWTLMESAHILSDKILENYKMIVITAPQLKTKWQSVILSKD